MVYAPDPDELEGWGILTSDEEEHSSQYYAGYDAGYESGYSEGWVAARKQSTGELG